MVLTFTDRGLYCPAGDFYIDPHRPVDRALITHGHADHARSGHGHYLATDSAGPVMQHRLGDISLETVGYDTKMQIGGAQVSFHPAGHVPGSAQIRVDVGGEVWVAAGDYKTVDDGLSDPFEPIRCHAFITESTFALPVFKWTDQAQLKADLNAWWAENRAAGKVSIIGAYSLGKAQRVMAALDYQGPILCHAAIENTNAVLRAQGVRLPDTVLVTADTDRKRYPGAMVICPPSAMGSAWARKFGAQSTAFASGWMALRGIRRRRAVDRGFIMSDHADWPGLNAAIAATGAEKVFVTHGYTQVFTRWLRDKGYDAHVVDSNYRGDTLDEGEGQ
ncbi:MAG: ligase-associated DNA damage response exonuclease [Pseudomonadota bacterium]